MSRDDEGVWHATCEFCGADVMSSVGPPHMSTITARPMDGEDASAWRVDLECYMFLMKFIWSIQHNAERQRQAS